MIREPRRGAVKRSHVSKVEARQNGDCCRTTYHGNYVVLDLSWKGHKTKEQREVELAILVGVREASSMISAYRRHQEEDGDCLRGASHLVNQAEFLRCWTNVVAYMGLQVKCNDLSAPVMATYRNWG